MKLGLSTLLYPDEPPMRTIQIASQFDLDYVEIILEPYFPRNPDSNYLKELGDSIKAEGLDVRVHGRTWDLNPTSNYPKIREIALTQARKGIKTCNLLGGDVITLHPGRCWFREGEEYLEKCMEKYIHYIEEVEEISREQGIKIAVETGGLGIDFPKGIPEFKRVTKSRENVGVTIDTGHLFLTAFRSGMNRPEQKIVNYIEELGDKLVNVHLHDNSGMSDEHRVPGRGKIDFAPVLKSLEDRYTGPIIFEIQKPPHPDEAAEEGIEWIREKIRRI